MSDDNERSRNLNADEELIHRRKNFAQRRSLSEYAVSLPNQPEDLSGVHPSDDRFHFFSKGRDFQPHKSKHHYTPDELQVLQTYESAGILPSQTEVYRQWLENMPARAERESWLVISLIAVVIGSLAFVMKETCEKLQIFSNPFVEGYVQRGQTFRLWMYYSGISCTFAAFASLVVVYICPFAAGSGLPEIIGVLNGVVVRNVLSFKTLVIKILSCIFTVLSGLPVGFEGPMIHIGAMVAACMARPVTCCNEHYYAEQEDLKSKGEKHKNGCCHCASIKDVCRYRDCQERYSLICVGAAAGVASAFSSPITGLTFSMEEMSSYWSNSLTWQTFVCCIIARSTTELLRSIVGSIEHWAPGEKLKIFELTESALFDMKEILELNVAAFVPAVIIGVMGGLLGSLFIFIHLKAAKFRRRVLAKVERPEILNLLKVLEPVVIALISSSLIMGVMPYFPCHTTSHNQTISSRYEGKYLKLRSFQCDLPIKAHFKDNMIEQTGMYHEGATLLFGSWEQMLRNLLSRRTHEYFESTVLVIIFSFFFIFSSWTAMTSIASGLLIPQLAIGALYGRLLGYVMFKTFESIIDLKERQTWDWLDPGAFALLGAASFMSGTSRLPITSVVMLVEMTNDINMSLLIMIVVMLSKFIGDLFTHPLYHSVLELKCIPYLDSDLRIYRKGKKLNLELFKIGDVMITPVDSVNVNESIAVLANLILDTNHGAFPVVRSNNDGLERTFLGIITRLELSILLTKTHSFDAKELRKEDIDRIRISYPEYSSNRLKDTITANAILNNYVTNITFRSFYVNLLPYINTSSHSVPKSFSLHRAYRLFRTLGLRHLVITDDNNQVEGIVSRKDLMGFSVEQKINSLLEKRKRERLIPGCSMIQSSQRFREESTEGPGGLQPIEGSEDELEDGGARGAP